MAVDIWHRSKRWWINWQRRLPPYPQMLRFDCDRGLQSFALNQKMRLGILVIIPFAGLAAFAADLPLASFSRPFNGSSMEIAWAAPTNGMPTTVRIFEVTPTSYSAATVSNLLRITGLTVADKKRVGQSSVLSAKDVSTYANISETRHLEIVPSRGAIVLHRADVTAGSGGVAVGVPDATRVVLKTFDLLSMLGIKKSEVATTIEGRPVRYTFVEHDDTYKIKAKTVTNIVSRGVNLSRQIDGIQVWGAGVLAEFGNEGRLAELIVTWHSIKPSRVCAVPNATDLVRRIKSGRAMIRNEQAGFSYRKLNIIQAQLYYWENDGFENQTTMVPFAALVAETDLPGENSNVQLYVPFASD